MFNLIDNKLHTLQHMQAQQEKIRKELKVTLKAKYPVSYQTLLENYTRISISIRDLAIEINKRGNKQ